MFAQNHRLIVIMKLFFQLSKHSVFVNINYEASFLAAMAVANYVFESTVE